MCIKRSSKYRVVSMSLDSESRVWDDIVGSAIDLFEDIDQIISLQMFQVLILLCLTQL